MHHGVIINDDGNDDNDDDDDDDDCEINDFIKNPIYILTI
jgi:hypothetical protein